MINDMELMPKEIFLLLNHIIVKYVLVDVILSKCVFSILLDFNAKQNCSKYACQVRCHIRTIWVHGKVESSSTCTATYEIGLLLGVHAFFYIPLNIIWYTPASNARNISIGMRDPLLWKLSRQHNDSGPRLNIKTVFPRYGDSHVKDKTVGETVLSLTWESLYW